MAKKNESTLRCVLTLTIIAVVCGLLLAISYPILYVPPKVTDLSDHFMTDAVWTVEEVNKTYSKGKNASIQMTGLAEKDSEKYIGVLVKTNKDGDLGESTFAIYFNKINNKLVFAYYVVDGATAGKNYSVYGDALNNYLGGSFEDYYEVEINKLDVFGGYTVPAKTGATKTLTSVYNAFNTASNYYYNVYVNGGAV